MVCACVVCIRINVHVQQSLGGGGGSGVVAHMLIYWYMGLTFLKLFINVDSMSQYKRESYINKM